MPPIQPRQLTERRLFDVPQGSTRTALVGSLQPDWYLYAAGYKLAADRLVEGLNYHGSHTDFVCLPILFLYRHYVELYLKALVQDAGEVLNAAPEQGDGHRLLPIWNRLRDRLVALDPNSATTWLDRAQALITELDTLDPGSFTFRYPVEKTGIPTLAPPRLVDMKHFADVIAELDMVLGGADAYVGRILDAKREYEGEADDYSLYYS